MNISQIIRREVRHFEPYLPGKPIAEVQRELKLKKIIKLASNENALGTSPRAVAAMRGVLKNSFRYPEGPGTLLRRALAEFYSLSPQEIVLGAGSDELIELLGKTFFRSGDEIIVSEHAFVRYKMAADLMGIRTREVPMKNFTHDLPGMLKAVSAKTKAIFIANPNNPTGTYVSQAQVEIFLKALEKRSQAEAPLVVFDEAYYEFSKALCPDYPDTLGFWRRHPHLNIAILRTFSKIYGLAGLRVGYGFFRSEVASALDRVRPPFNVSNVAQAAAVAALDDKRHVEKSAALVAREMKFLGWELSRLKLAYLPSAANFLLIEVAPRLGREVFQALLKRGVIVRAMDEYGFPKHVRVTIGTPKENKFFIQQLREVLKPS